jgi:uncharacterized protein YukE
VSDQSILGGDAVLGSPGVLDALTSQMGVIADHTDDIARHLRSETFEGTWSGDAADSFHGLLSQVPDELEKVTGSYRVAATTLRTFNSALRDSMNRADWIAGRLEEAMGRASNAQARLDDANRRSRQAWRDLQAAQRINDTASQASAQQRLEAARYDGHASSRELEWAQNDINSLKSQADNNRRQFEQSVQACCDGLDNASNLGYKNSPLSMLDRVGRDIGSALGPVVAVLGDLAAKAWDIGAALEAFVADPSLDRLKRVLDDASAALTILALAALVVSAVFQPEFLVGAAGFLFAANRAVDIAEIGVDTVRFATGTGTIWDIGADALSAYSDGRDASDISEAFDKSASAGSKSWATRYIKYADLNGYQAGGHLLETRIEHAGRDVAEDGGISWLNDHLNDWVPIGYLGARPIYAVSAGQRAEVVNKPLATICNNGLTVLFRHLRRPTARLAGAAP